ncbi:MAG: hypothetical protein ACREJ2_05270 [Planctomycetota bacterium]
MRNHRRRSNFLAAMIGGLTACAFGAAVLPAALAAEDAGAADHAKPADAHSPAPRWTITLTDEGTLTGAILKKTPAAWVILTDDGQEVTIARERIGRVRPAPPKPDQDKDRHADDHPSDHHDAPPPPPSTGGDHAKADPPAQSTGGDPNSHPQVVVQMKDGRTITGQVEKHDDHVVVLRLDGGKTMEIHRDDMKSIHLASDKKTN